MARVFTSKLFGVHYLQNSSKDSNFGQNCVRKLKKPSETFKRPEYLQHAQNKTVK